ncbi:glycosyltransferase family 2 protein [soil metagenome]
MTPPPTPAISVAIHLAVLVFWVALFLLAFGRGGLFAWSIGLAYLAYDTGLQIFTGSRIARIRHGDKQSGETRGHSVAVLIAARNEAIALPGTLAALLACDDPPEEILIADDGSDDDTAEVLHNRFGLSARELGVPSAPVWSGTTAIIWLRLAQGGKASALNAALAVTSCDVVLTVDADTIVERAAIAAVRQAFSRDQELVAATGVITPVCTPTPAGRVLQWFQTYEYIGNFLSRHAWMQIDCLQLISGAFAGFRRDAVIAVGGFDDTCLVEDYELVARMQRYAGDRGLVWRFRVLGDAQARTEAPGSVPAFLAQRRRWFGGFLQTQWWYRAMVGDRRFGSVGTVMLPIKAVDTAQPVYGLTAFAMLVFFVATGRIDILGPVLLVVAGKLVIDVGYQLWSLRRYRRWVGDHQRGSVVGAAAAALLGPVTFQLLLQTGAALGWIAFLSGARTWGRRHRFGMAVH